MENFHFAILPQEKIISVAQKRHYVLFKRRHKAMNGYSLDCYEKHRCDDRMNENG